VAEPERYRPIGDYALIGDCHTAALVSAEGSIDWCCLPRFDAGSVFARLLDHDAGGYCALIPADGGSWEGRRSYLEDSFVLETMLTSGSGQVRIVDCFVLHEGERSQSERRIVRVIEGVKGRVRFDIRIVPRFDYGEIRPWIRRHGRQLFSATGGNDAVLVWCTEELEEAPEHELSASVEVGVGDRVHLTLCYSPPELIGEDPPEPDAASLDRDIEQTIACWRRWAKTLRLDGRDGPAARRSGLVLKALTFVPTGAIVAAPTTSLPEVEGGVRNWDYRYAWIRDASFSSRAFVELGAETEADAFRAFVMRSAAGHADDLQIAYGVGGERRLEAGELSGLEGWRGSSPVSVGNGAASQRQLDAYGELVNLTWRWHRRGHSPSDDDWRFLVSLIDRAAEQWQEPDCGIWEWAGEPEHFVHSKVLCWSALDRGIRLADECMRRAPLRKWKRARSELRKAIESRGYDSKRGVFVQSFDRSDMDAALLLLPSVEFVDWRDERMLRTAAAIREELDAGDGLLYRYRRSDGLPGREGAFLCCSFWLAECLAHQDELEDARTVFDRAVSTANDVGLFSEEVDPGSGELLGNFPQGLTHLAHISAAVALADPPGASTE
jgi:GH15 family glucan-1,4-alpha-glucosidase